MTFKKFEKNIQSQFGEDGVIEEIFKRIGYENKICVEFGAWDGVHLSNTWNLWHNEDWTAYLIEGDPVKAQALERSIKDFPKVKAINAYVTPEGKSCLDNILKEYNLPENFDLLSIDIDGDDYYILKHLKTFRPKVIIIEFNPTVPPHIEMVQEMGEYMGASALSIIKLGESKGYRAIHITEVNVLFVTNELYASGNFQEINLEDEFIRSHLNYVLTTFDGIPFLSSNLHYGSLKEREKPSKGGIKSLMRKFLKRKKSGDKSSLPAFKSNPPLIPVEIFKK
jgi:hypothetical protein